MMRDCGGVPGDWTFGGKARKSDGFERAFVLSSVLFGLGTRWDEETVKVTLVKCDWLTELSTASVGGWMVRLFSGWVGWIVSILFSREAVAVLLLR